MYPHYYDKVLLFIIDVASYDKIGCQGLSIVYPKMTHFILMAHDLYCVAKKLFYGKFADFLSR